ncbi:phage tail tape measure protein [Escherichia coli]|nr:phage tail tape measure protein [Escherichia coli]
MTISFNTIPSNTLVPLFYAEMDNQAANTAQDSGASLLIGHANNGAEIVANSLVLMPSADYARQICGAGSQLARMVEAYRQTDPFGELYVIAVPESTGAAATVTLTVTGAATETGTVNVYVGRTRVQAPVTKRTGVLKAIFGDDAETLQVVNALIDKGKDGYDQIQQKMNKQASLNKRVQAQLGTLSNLWEAMTGTATNGLAAIGGAFSGDAKNITQWLGVLGEKFTKFADENPRVIRGVVGLAAGLAILKLGLMGVGGAISIVSRIMSMTPIGMIATAIALAAGLIITNWDVVGPYFKKLWETIGPYFEAGWELLKKVFAWSPLGMVINNWGPVVKWFQDMWDKLKPIIEWFTDSSGDTVDAINSAQWGAGAYDAYGTGIPARGYTPYQAVDPAQSNNASDATGPNPFMINKASAPKVAGEIKVSFVNSPPGMRVMETRSSGFDVSHDVGYTRFGR